MSAITVKHDQGGRYVATLDEYSVFAGTAEENSERNSMGPGKLFIAALGMCTLGDILPFCERHDIPAENIAIELEEERVGQPSRAASVTLTIKIAQELSKGYQQAILRAAEQCFVRQSITHSVDVRVSLSAG